MSFALQSAGGSFEDEMLKRESESQGGSKGPRVDIPFNELEILVTIGTGTFGRVKLVQHKATGTVAALKAMSKVCGWGVYSYDFLVLPSTSYHS